MFLDPNYARKMWTDAIVALERIAARSGCPVPRVVEFDKYLYAMDDEHYGYSILVWGGGVWQPHTRRIA
jgi:hypothetical protein